MKKITIIMLTLFFMLSACQKNETRTSNSKVKISKMHDLCTSGPSIFVKAYRSAPDFVYGDIADEAGGVVAYYVSSEPSAIEDLRVEKKLSENIAANGVNVYREKFSDGREAILLAGYVAGIDRRTKVDVRFTFATGRKKDRALAEALASATNICTNL